jgi:hypothetical protein
VCRNLDTNRAAIEYYAILSSDGNLASFKDGLQGERECGVEMTVCGACH